MRTLFFVLFTMHTILKYSELK